MSTPDFPPTRRRTHHARRARAWLAVLVCPLLSAAAAQEPASFALTDRQARELGIEWTEVRPAARIRLDGLTAELMLPIDRSTAVAAPFAGRVTRVLADEGDTVDAGHVLAHVASRDYAAARARLEKATTSHALARSRVAREESLLAEGIAPLARVERSRAELRTLATEVEAARTMLNGLAPVADAPATYALRAGLAGHVAERRVLAGEPIAELQVAFVIAEDRSLRAEIRVPRADAAGVKTGDVARLGDVVATVTGRGATVEPATQTVRILARVPPGSGLLPGQRVEASLESAAPAHTWELPRAALARRDGHTEVYVAAGERVKVVPVEPVAESRATAVVRGALNAGDRVAVKGVSALKAHDAE